MAHLTVGLDPDLAADYLTRGDAGPKARRLDEVVRAIGTQLAPQTPGLRPEDIAPTAEEIVWFTCEVDEQLANEPARRLLEVEGVRSAYVVAPEGPP